jgi:hypothetical protein
VVVEWAGSQEPIGVMKEPKQFGTLLNTDVVCPGPLVPGKDTSTLQFLSRH